MIIIIYWVVVGKQDTSTKIIFCTPCGKFLRTPMCFVYKKPTRTYIKESTLLPNAYVVNNIISNQFKTYVYVLYHRGNYVNGYDTRRQSWAYQRVS